MNRTALIGLVLGASACNFPIAMVEVEAPEVCVTRRVAIDATAGATTPIPAKYGQLPSQMGVDLSGSVGTTVDVTDNIVDLPADAKDLIDLDVQIKKIQLVPLADDPLTLSVDESLVLDGVQKISLVIVPPAGSSLTKKSIIAYDRAAAGTPSGGAIVAVGQSLNLAEYLYAGQVAFDYEFNIALPAGPYGFDATVCIATKGHAEASIGDIQDFASGKKKL